MATILKPGDPKKIEPKIVVTCDKCDSQIEYRLSESNSSPDPRDRGVRRFTCLCCDYVNYRSV